MRPHSGDRATHRHLTHHRERAMWWYNHVFMPIGLRLQKKLQWQPGLIDDPRVDTVLMVCRKRRTGRGSLDDAER